MSENKLLVYLNLGSQPARAVQALLAIGKIDHEAIEIDLRNWATKTPEWEKINPFGQLPFIKTEDGLGIAESNAILQYLCEKNHEKIGYLYGHDLNSRTKINIILSWYQGTFRPAFTKKIHLKIYDTLRDGIPHTETQIKQADLKIMESLKHLERILSDNKYVAGETLSIADLLVYFEATTLIYYEMEDKLKEFEKVSAWYEAMEMIPEIKEIQAKWASTIPVLRNVLSCAPPIKG